MDPTRVCPTPGTTLPDARSELDGEQGLCWVGPNYEAGTAMGHGKLSTGPAGGESRIVSAYSFGHSGSVKVQAYDASGVLLRGCVAVDNSADQRWVNVTFSYETCRGAAYVLVTGHLDLNGDL